MFLNLQNDDIYFDIIKYFIENEATSITIDKAIEIIDDNTEMTKKNKLKYLANYFYLNNDFNLEISNNQETAYYLISNFYKFTKKNKDLSNEEMYDRISTIIYSYKYDEDYETTADHFNPNIRIAIDLIACFSILDMRKTKKNINYYAKKFLSLFSMIERDNKFMIHYLNDLSDYYKDEPLEYYIEDNNLVDYYKENNILTLSDLSNASDGLKLLLSCSSFYHDNNMIYFATNEGIKKIKSIKKLIPSLFKDKPKEVIELLLGLTQVQRASCFEISQELDTNVQFIRIYASDALDILKEYNINLYSFLESFFNFLNRDKQNNVTLASLNNYIDDFYSYRLVYHLFSDYAKECDEPMISFDKDKILENKIEK